MRTHTIVVFAQDAEGKILTSENKATGKKYLVEMTRLPRWMIDGSNAPKNRGKKGKRKGKRFGGN